MKKHPNSRAAALVRRSIACLANITDKSKACSILAIALVLLLIAAVVLLPRSLTRYAPNYTEPKLVALGLGSDLQAVTNALGFPLSFTLLAQADENGRYFPNRMLDFENLSIYASRQDALLLLRYSEPKNVCIYQATELCLINGRLSEVRRFMVMFE